MFSSTSALPWDFWLLPPGFFKLCETGRIIPPSQLHLKTALVWELTVCFSPRPPGPGPQRLLVYRHPESAPGQCCLRPPADWALLQAVPGAHEPRGRCGAAHRHHEAAALQRQDDVCQGGPEPGPGSLWQVSGNESLFFYTVVMSVQLLFLTLLWVFTSQSSDKTCWTVLHLHLMLMKCCYQITSSLPHPTLTACVLLFPWVDPQGRFPSYRVFLFQLERKTWVNL